jgi:hypothetical protein
MAGAPVSAPSFGMPTSAVPASGGPTTPTSGVPVSGGPVSGGPMSGAPMSGAPHDPLQPGVPLWGSTTGPSGPAGAGAPPFGPPGGPGRAGARRAGRNNVKWILAAVAAFVVLAGGGAVAATKLLSNDDEPAGNSANQGQNAGDPLGGDVPGAAETGNGGANQGGGGKQQLTVDRTVWYAGKKITVSSAAYDPAADNPVQIDVKMENLSAEGDNNARYMPVFLTYDGQSTQGRIDELDELLAKATSKATLLFKPEDPLGNLKAATLTIGDNKTVQAVVPLGDPAKTQAHEPKKIADEKAFTAGLLDFRFSGCQFRGDFPDRHEQAPTDSYMVYCVFDVKYTKTSGSNYFAAKEGFRLKLPDGTIVTAQHFRPPLMDPQEQARDVPIGFEIRWPAPGAYVLQVHDAGSYGQQGPGPGNLTEIPMTLS